MYKILLSKYFKISTNSLPLSLYYKKREESTYRSHARILSLVKHLDYAFHPFRTYLHPPLPVPPGTLVKRLETIPFHRYKSLERIPPFFSTTAPMKYSYSAGIYNPRYRFLMGEKGQTCCDRNC